MWSGSRFLLWTAGRAGKAACAVLAGILARWRLSLLLIHALFQGLSLLMILSTGGIVVFRRDVLYRSRGAGSPRWLFRLHLGLVAGLVAAHGLPPCAPNYGPICTRASGWLIY